MRTVSRALACAAFFYPVYWVATAVVFALPSLLAGGFSRESLQMVRVSPLSVGGMRLDPLSELTAAVVLAAGLVGWLARPRHAGGMFVAVAASLALQMPVAMALFGRGVRWGPIAVYGALLIAGLWRMTSEEEGGFPRRLACLSIGFVAPLCVMALLQSRNWRMPVIGVAPAAAGALAAAALPRRQRMGELAPPAWKAVAAGVVVSALTAGFGHATGTALRESREAQRKASREAIAAALPKLESAEEYPRLFFQKGVNFTAEGPWGYRPEKAEKLLDELRAKGVNAIALVPYGFQRSGQDPEIRLSSSMEAPEDIEVLGRMARQRGLRVMLKPQIWLGGGGFPGDVKFDDPAARARWFANYTRFVEFNARLAAKMHADIYCLGTELRHMAMYDGEWRRMIARAREIYPGPLVYAAMQGEEFESIRFWDALDYIGLNNYYPLSADFSAERALHKVEDVQRRYQKPVIFPEAGFASLKDPHRAPWDETYREWSGADQAKAYEAVFQAFYGKPWFHGVYWWKVGTNGSGGQGDHGHSPWRKPAMDVVARWYRDGGR